MRKLLQINILLLLIFVGCKKESTSNTKIDSNVVIIMREQLGRNQKTLLLVCTTEKSYGCSNRGIAYKINKTNDRIDITFNNIVYSEVCLTSLGPATTVIDLGDLQTGTYKLNVIINRTVIKGELVVTPERYAISLANNTQLQLPEPVLQRIPANTIWGTVGYHTTSSAATAQAAIDAFVQAGATVRTYSPGKYWYFTIDANGQILPPQNHGYWFVKPFIFQYVGDSNQLITTLQQIKAQYGNALAVTVNTINGKVLF